MELWLPHIARPEGRVHFACDHTSSWPGWMNGALQSGNRAAREVNQAAEPCVRQLAIVQLSYELRTNQPFRAHQCGWHLREWEVYIRERTRRIAQSSMLRNGPTVLEIRLAGVI